MDETTTSRVQRALPAVLITVVSLLGAFGSLMVLRSSETVDLLKFGVYLALSVAGSFMKIKLPGIDGSMSVNFFFVFISMVELSPAETLLIGCVCVLPHYFWQMKTAPKAVHILFNLATVALAISGASGLYRWHVLVDAGAKFPLVLAVTVCVYFVLNTLPVALIISFTGPKPFGPVWNYYWAWFFPYYVTGAVITAILHQVTLLFGWQVSILTLPVIYLMYRTYRSYLAQLEAERTIAEEQRMHAEDMAKLHLRTIESLALAIDAKDQNTHTHLQRVQVYAVEIAKELNLSEPEIEALRAASLLHDVGKLAVPEHIVTKPGKLTPEEFEKMKIHPIVGAEILEYVQFPYPVVPVVRHHHEKWDGSGYPDGLAGEAIPIGARILAAVDCLDALTSERQYRPAIRLDEAMGVVSAEAGRSFDPKIVQILKKRYLEFESKSRLSAENDRPTSVRLPRAEPVPSTASAAAKREEGAETRSSDPADFMASIAAARTEVQALFDMAQSLGNSLSLEETLQLLATRLKNMLPYDGLALYVCRDGILAPEYVAGQDRDFFAGLQIPIGEGLSGYVAETREPVINGVPSVEGGYLNDPTRFSFLRSALAVPLEGRDRLVGVLTLYRAAKDAFTRDNLRILQAISVKLGASLENGLKYRLASGDATTDYLTGLPNARSLFLHLESECRKAATLGESLSIFLCDLDGFKLVNDRYGHLEGNQLLRMFASTMRENCRPEDYVARLGGDEFVIVITGISEDEEDSAVQRFRILTEGIAREFHNIDFFSVSVGCARFGRDGQEPDQLLAEADRLMYRAKSVGKRDRSSRLTAPPDGSGSTGGPGDGLGLIQ